LFNNKNTEMSKKKPAAKPKEVKPAKPAAKKENPKKEKGGGYGAPATTEKWVADGE
jgi:hypothetical protein